MFFFPLLSLWTRQFWCLLVLLLFFVSLLPHWQNVSPWILFSSGETKTSYSGRDWVNREGGAWESCRFGQKLMNIQHGVGRSTCKSPIMNGQTWVFKKIHWSRTQPLKTIPAGTMIQMGSWNTHLERETCTTRGPPSRRYYFFRLRSPLISFTLVTFVL